MANLKSTVLTDLDATRRKVVNARLASGAVREAVESLTPGSSEGVGDVLRFVRLPTRARLSQVLVASDGGGTTGAGSLGFYRTNDGEVVDADALATGVDLTTDQDPTDVVSIAPSDYKKQLWELAGESSDPGGHYDLALTLTAAVDADTEAAVIARYVLTE